MDIFFHAFWLFLILAAVSPYVQQQLLFAARARKLSELEQRRKSRVITLIHREESRNVLGIPAFRHLTVDDPEEVLRAVRLTDDEVPIDLIVHTPEDLFLAEEQIARALLMHPAKVTVFVPLHAMSGGTMIALAADEIVMDADAMLGPVDPQIGGYPAASILAVLEHKALQDIADETLMMADLARKALKQVRGTVRYLLQDKGLEQESVEKIAQLLTQGTWTHDYPISVKEARDMGLSLSTEMPPEVYDLMSLYQQPRGRPLRR